jgi:hypothetical protein
MKYVSLGTLQSGLPTRPRLAILRAGPMRGREYSKDDGGSVDFDEAIDCRICRPKFISVSNSGVGLLRVGFLVSLDEGIQLRWARFRLVFGSKEIEVTSLFPRCVTQPQAFEGRIAVGDGGELSWYPVDADGTETSAAIFAPRVLGHRIDATSVFWDFLPWNWREPPGTDNLVIALRMKSGLNLHLTARILLSVVHPDHGEVHLELPAKSLEVDAMTVG